MGSRATRSEAIRELAAVPGSFRVGSEEQEREPKSVLAGIAKTAPGVYSGTPRDQQLTAIRLSGLAVLATFKKFYRGYLSPLFLSIIFIFAKTLRR